MPIPCTPWIPPASRPLASHLCSAKIPTLVRFQHPQRVLTTQNETSLWPPHCCTVTATDQHPQQPLHRLCYGATDHNNAGAHNFHTIHITSTTTPQGYTLRHSSSHTPSLAIQVLPWHGPTCQPATTRMEHTGGHSRPACASTPAGPLQLSF